MAIYHKNNCLDKNEKKLKRYRVLKNAKRRFVLKDKIILTPPAYSLNQKRTNNLLSHTNSINYTPETYKSKIFKNNILEETVGNNCALLRKQPWFCDVRLHHLSLDSILNDGIYNIYLDSPEIKSKYISGNISPDFNYNKYISSNISLPDNHTSSMFIHQNECFQVPSLFSANNKQSMNSDNKNNINFKSKNLEKSQIVEGVKRFTNSHFDEHNYFINRQIDKLIDFVCRKSFIK